MSVRINNRLPQFRRSIETVIDDAYRVTAREVLKDAKTHAPFQKGGLRADSGVRRQSAFRWWIYFEKEYARFQEHGGDSKRTVRNYSTPGTGKHFLRNAGIRGNRKLLQNIKIHLRRARA